MKYLINAALFCSASLLLFACDDKYVKSNENSVMQSTIHIETDQWIGKWNGPEGTFLQINGKQGQYEIIIQDLDSVHTYPAISNGNNIQFERNGLTETIYASNGIDTGMKWLRDKSNCLRIRSGEGYCRD